MSDAKPPKDTNERRGILSALIAFVMCIVHDYFYPLLWLTCKFKGHDFKPAKQYLLPARQCSRCDLHQVKLPDAGCLTPGWASQERETLI